MSGCGTCLFYVPVKGPDGKPVAAGECRRHPPGPLTVERGRAKWAFPHVPPDHPICGDYFCPPTNKPRLAGTVPQEPDALMSVPRGAWDFLQTRIADERLGQAAPSAGDGVPATPDVGERQAGPRLYDPDRE